MTSPDKCSIYACIPYLPARRAGTNASVCIYVTSFHAPIWYSAATGLAIPVMIVSLYSHFPNGHSQSSMLAGWIIFPVDKSTVHNMHTVHTAAGQKTVSV